MSPLQYALLVVLAVESTKGGDAAAMIKMLEGTPAMNFKKSLRAWGHLEEDVAEKLDELGMEVLPVYPIWDHINL